MLGVGGLTTILGKQIKSLLVGWWSGMGG